MKDPVLWQVVSLLAFTASCKDPGNPLNGRKLGDDFRHKKTVSFTCQKNYVLEGARTVTCLNGQWSAKMPICQGEFFRKIMINARSCMLFKGFSFLSALMLSLNPIATVNRWYSEINFHRLFTTELFKWFWKAGINFQVFHYTEKPLELFVNTIHS